MSLKKCSIIFNNRSQNVYYNGENVSGFVSLVLDKKKKCQALTVRVSGETNCKWMENYGSGKTKRQTEFTGREIYLDFNMDLISPQANNEQVELMAGKHDYGFSFILPQNLPSSFEGTYGCVRYTMQVIYKRLNYPDQFYKIAFMVITNINLNSLSYVRLPIKHVSSKDFHFLLASMGTLKITIESPVSGYVPGQKIPIKCYLQNLSKVNIEEVKISLVQITTFQTTCPQSNQKVESKNVAQCKNDGVAKEEEKIIIISLKIPVIPPSTFLTCSIIEVKYELKFLVTGSGVHGSKKFSVPITIGTVPFSPFQDQGTSSRDPTAPPAYTDIVAPSYEEVVVEKRMKGKYEEWDYSPNFVPRYPVYKYSTNEPEPEIIKTSAVDNIVESIKNTECGRSHWHWDKYQRIEDMRLLKMFIYKCSKTKHILGYVSKVRCESLPG
ncbi:arrestin domain-containing protein 2-like [Arctopsyche grandis]|uniref:arrestin domain-containing protein 2-like n=1 Tax=Arctopsyche grandis TaxID=121162 RepID=UPI00406D9D81